MISWLKERFKKKPEEIKRVHIKEGVSINYQADLKLDQRVIDALKLRKPKGGE